MLFKAEVFLGEEKYVLAGLVQEVLVHLACPGDLSLSQRVIGQRIGPAVLVFSLRVIFGTNFVVS